MNDNENFQIWVSRFEVDVARGVEKKVGSIGRGPFLNLALASGNQRKIGREKKGIQSPSEKRQQREEGIAQLKLA